jgi:D-proline reductase (dithiol) PrdB
MKRKMDKVLGKLFTRVPALTERWARSREWITNAETPWAPFTEDLKYSQIALVTTAGVHLRSQHPFGMDDKAGDPTFREIPSWVRADDLMITHDYYDHDDADQDINVVFPVERLRELASEGVIGEVAPRHFSFMGHILGRQVETLIQQTGPEVARRLKTDGANAAFLTPA